MGKTKQPIIVNNIVKNLAPFNEKAVRYMLDCADNWLNVAEGGKRAGKNVMNIAMWCDVVDNHDDFLHLIGGVTSSSAKVNILDCNGYGVLAYFEGRIIKGTYQGLEAYFVDTPKGQKIIIPVGMGNKDSHERFQGFTVGSAYITEAILCHMNSIEEIQTRLMSSSNRKLFMDLNPEAPGHRFYTDFLDVQSKKKKENPSYGFNYGHFTIFDNESIETPRLMEILESYDKQSIFYQMDILGKRITSYGRIYTSFDRHKVLVSEQEVEQCPPIHFSIGVDTGSVDATTVTLMGFSKDYEICYLMDAFYHKQGKQTGMEHSTYARLIADKIMEWSRGYHNFFNTPIFCESADKFFRTTLAHELQARGLYMPVEPAWKKDGILNRIRLNSSLIGDNRFRIMNLPVFTPWIEGYENASWSDKDFQDGKWVRVDNGSVPIDCLDSTEYAMYPFKDRLVKRSDY